MKKSNLKILLSAVLLGITAGLTHIAKTYTEQFFAVYPPISKKIVSTLSDLTSFCSFDVWEVIAAVLVLWRILNLRRCIKKRDILKWLSESVLCVSGIVFLFVGLWGLNYYAPPMSQRLDLVPQQYTVEELAELTRYFCTQANRYADMVERDENGLVKTDFATMSHQAGDAYINLAKDMPIFDGSVAPVKKLLTGRIFTMRGTTGIFMCITGESNVSRYVYPAELPFTMCHEIGHRMAFAREDEANFAGFLACTASDNVAFKYSGYYLAFIYCYNALYRTDQTTALRIMYYLANRNLKSDLDASHAHYDAIEIKKAVEVSDRIYGEYLQSFGVESGVQSYGEVVDLLAMWYFQRVKT